MRVPVTARLEEAVVAALDAAVETGLADTRAGLIEAAVSEWLDRHGEEAIVDSYRKRYADPDQELERLQDAFLGLSIEAFRGEGLL